MFHATPAHRTSGAAPFGSESLVATSPNAVRRTTPPVGAQPTAALPSMRSASARSTRTDSHPRRSPTAQRGGPTAPLRIVVLDGHPITEVFDVAEAPREVAVDEQHAWADAFAALAPQVVGVFERRAADQCLRDGAPLPSWVQRDIVEWSDAGFTPDRYRALAAALEDATLLRHPAHPLHDDERGAHPERTLPYVRLRPEHWTDWAVRVASGADPVIEATVVLDSLR